MPRRAKPVIVELPDGRYAFRIRAPKGHPDGVRPQFSTDASGRPLRSARDAERAWWKKLDEYEAWNPDVQPEPDDPPTMTALVEEFLPTYVGGAYTKRCLGWNLKHVAKPTGEGGLGEIRVDRLDAAAVAKWRAKLPDGSRWHVHKSLVQLLNSPAAEKFVARNVASKVANPRPRQRPGRAKVETFTWSELDAIAECLPAEWKSIPHFAAATGLRPEEWIALRRSDLDLNADVPYVTVERAYSHGELKDTKTGGVRRVPLQDEALAALDRHAFRIDLPLVFYEIREARKPRPEPWIALDNFRVVWKIACEDAGVRYRTPYALRHTYAAEALAAGVPTFNVARRMGTSLQMIDATYGHLVRSADEWEVARLNARAKAARREADDVATFAR
jgi:integrase